MCVWCLFGRARGVTETLPVMVKVTVMDVDGVFDLLPTDVIVVVIVVVVVAVVVIVRVVLVVVFGNGFDFVVVRDRLLLGTAHRSPPSVVPPLDDDAVWL